MSGRRQRRNQPGCCRWCGCTYEDPCPGSCGWANADQTLCTACVDVDREWRRLTASRKPNMVRAFFRGFMAGSDDERATESSSKSPYTKDSESSKYWWFGVGGGARQAR